MLTRTGSERLEIAKPYFLHRSSRLNTYKHSRLTYACRLEMVRQMTFEGRSFAGAAAENDVPRSSTCSASNRPG